MAKPTKPTKPTKGRDRRDVLEGLRRDQKRAEKKRTYVVVAACALVALVIVGLGAFPLLQQSRIANNELAALGSARDSAGCQPLKTQPANGNQQHETEGTPINYPDAPPAYGPHYPVTAPFARKFYSANDRPAIEYLVHNLEHGYTLLWYDDTVAGNAGELGVVKAIADKYSGQKLTDKFIAVPWTSQDGKAFPGGAHLALTHWSAGGDPTKPGRQVGVWQYCAKPSGAVVKSFVKDYPYSDSPEPQAM